MNQTHITAFKSVLHPPHNPHLIVNRRFLCYEKFYKGMLKFGVRRKERHSQDKGEMETHHGLQLANVK